jgi:arylamine N-acetyltransferase
MWTPAAAGAALQQAERISICSIEKANGAINKMIQEQRLHELVSVTIDEAHMLADKNRCGTAPSGLLIGRQNSSGTSALVRKDGASWLRSMMIQEQRLHELVSVTIDEAHMLADTNRCDTTLAAPQHGHHHGVILHPPCMSMLWSCSDVLPP